MSALIACRFADRPDVGAACGAFDSEHHAYAASLGLCCAVAAFRDLDQADDLQTVAPTAADWPPFTPTDDDAPAVD